MRLFVFLIFVLFCLGISLPIIWAKEGRFAYDVKMGFVTIGRAELEDKGLVKKDGVEYRHLSVYVNTKQFKDREDIFANEKGLPVIVERDLVLFGKKEKIVEYYNQKKGTVTIVKNGQLMELSPGPGVENVFLFIMKNRNKDIRKLNGSKIKLPVGDYELLVRDGNRVSTKAGVFSTWLVLTRPSKIKLWFDKKTGIPVRVAGAIPVLPYVLSLIKE